METTYKILGGDGKEYGPVTLDQMLAWIRDGRVDAATQVWRNDQNGWVTARQLPELQLAAPLPPAPPIGGPMTIDRQHVVSRMKSGGSWFYWIAGLSLINTIAGLTKSGWGFIVGLGITQIIPGRAEALVANVLFVGLFILFGVFANKGHLWAFIVGMLVYALDGVIFAMAGQWLAAAFHGFVLFCLFNGLRAAKELNASA